MLKKLVNEARFKMTITANGPLLVKSGHPTLVGPDMTPVLTFRHGESQVYLPGSSLKGVFRSHVEKVIRTIRQNAVVVCNPFLADGKEQNCGLGFTQLEKKRKAAKKVEASNGDEEAASLSTEFVYSKSCPACRLFGSTHFIGRVSIGDAYLVDESDPRPTETRDGVGIDRLTGGAADKAKFDLEVVSSGTAFSCDVLLRNFECWQLGALLLVLQDMNDGLVFVGSGKSRGLGAVRAEVSIETPEQVQKFTLAHIGQTPERASNTIWGLGKFLGDNSYGTWSDDLLQLEQAPAPITRSIRQLQNFSEAALAELQKEAIDAFLKRMESYPEHNVGAST